MLTFKHDALAVKKTIEFSSKVKITEIFIPVAGIRCLALHDMISWCRVQISNWHEKEKESGQNTWIAQDSETSMCILCGSLPLAKIREYSWSIRKVYVVTIRMPMHAANRYDVFNLILFEILPVLPSCFAHQFSLIFSFIFQVISKF